MEVPQDEFASTEHMAPLPLPSLGFLHTLCRFARGWTPPSPSNDPQEAGCIASLVCFVFIFYFYCLLYFSCSRRPFQGSDLLCGSLVWLGELNVGLISPQAFFGFQFIGVILGQLVVSFYFLTQVRLTQVRFFKKRCDTSQLFHLL